MLKYCQVVGLVIISLVSCQDDYVSECPEDNGFFADALQCDRYYECRDGEVYEEFCPDGLVFDEASTSYAKCGFPFSIDCTGRDERQPAQPTPGCPHQHGYFSVPDETVCNKFNFCVDGVPNTITCAGGLIFDPEKGQCGYSDQTTRAGCTSGDLFGFQCPEESAQGYSRHSDPEDCQFFYLCIDGKARRNGCSLGDVFDPVSLSCQRQDKVDGPCGSWYNQTFIESLKQPKPSPQSAIRTNRLPNKEDKRRPSRPAVPRRQQVAQEQLPEESLPQQLADLERFGQPKNEVSAPTFGQNNRVNIGRGRGRGRGQVPRRQQVANTPARQQTTPARPFTRPPRRRPQRVENRFIDTEVPTDTDNEIDILQQVEAELAGRERNSNENLGPSALDALLTNNQEDEPILSEPVLRQKFPASRGRGFSRGRGDIPRRVPASRR